MNIFKKLFVKPKISWIIINLEDDGTLSRQTCYGKQKLLEFTGRGGPRGFYIVLEDDNAVMRWIDGSPGIQYQIETESSDTFRSFFEDAETLVFKSMPDKLLSKDELSWKKRELCFYGDITFDCVNISPEKLDNTYDLYRIIFYFVRICLTKEFENNKISSTGYLYINFPAENDTKRLFANLFATYLKQYHQYDQWEVVVGNENFKPGSLIALDSFREKYYQFLKEIYDVACQEMAKESLDDYCVQSFMSYIPDRNCVGHKEITYALGESFYKKLKEYSSKHGCFDWERKAYFLKQRGSNPAYSVGVVAVCSSLDRAIELLKEEYHRLIDIYKPLESKLEIDGVKSKFRISEEPARAWIEIHITEDVLDERINVWR